MAVTLGDGLLLVIAATLLVMTSQLIRLVQQVSEAVGKLEKLGETIDEVRQLARSAETALLDVRKTGARIDRIVETVEQGTTLIRQLFMPFSWRLGALAAGAKAGFEVLRHGTFRHGNGAVAVRGGVK
ncbi:MAG: hypothetical protein COV75_02815 [Candidatus Omnitrophica bacterium CG11_big_fil_rev_8_21_14_0_20_63_9]|nr:MAG: hypothetical protein COV75_02815 [Candidatus Omnitrophica bacterium CG11_big_fil_rev_8_21_14_0_20_63_9]